jgi:hypothetical protein
MDANLNLFKIKKATLLSGFEVGATGPAWAIALF